MNNKRQVSSRAVAHDGAYRREPISRSVRRQSDPLMLLLEEHGEVLRYLARLQSAVDSIASVGFSAEAYQEIVEVVRYIDTAVRFHSEREEKYLYPLLDRHAVSPLAIMRNEHRVFWGTFNQLMKTVSDIEEGRLHGRSIRELLDMSQQLIQVMSSCIRGENEVVFPLARHVLTGSEFEELRQQMAAAHA